MNKEYKTLKEKGLVTILNTGTSYALSYKQFNSYGEQIEDRVESINDLVIKQQNESLQAQIDANNTFLTDLETTPITPPIKEPLPAEPTP